MLLIRKLGQGCTIMLDTCRGTLYWCMHHRTKADRKSKTIILSTELGMRIFKSIILSFGTLFEGVEDVLDHRRGEDLGLLMPALLGKRHEVRKTNRKEFLL